MRTPSAFRKLDDRVLGDRGKGKGKSDHDTRDEYDDADDDRADDDRTDDRTDDDGRSTQETRGEKRGGGGGGSGFTGKGLSAFLTIVYKVSRLVFLALAAVVLLGIVFVYVPVNESNVIVRNVMSLAETVAGPFKDVFQIEDPDRNVAANYGLAAGVYFLLSTLVGKLPTGSRKAGG